VHAQRPAGDVVREMVESAAVALRRLQQVSGTTARV
jgi:hypothetical protein